MLLRQGRVIHEAGEDKAYQGPGLPGTTKIYKVGLRPFWAPWPEI